MADLKVDYSLLASIEGTLGGLKSEFDGLEDQSGGYDWAYGSGDITGAMGNFSGNWSIHRQKLLGKMEALSSMVSDTITKFKDTDTNLKNQMSSSSK
jgi:hypothetical protein